MLGNYIKAKGRAVESKTYLVKAELIFTDEQLEDDTPITLTAKQLFDMVCEAEEVVAEDTRVENLMRR